MLAPSLAVLGTAIPHLDAQNNPPQKDVFVLDVYPIGCAIIRAQKQQSDDRIDRRLLLPTWRWAKTQKVRVSYLQPLRPVKWKVSKYV